MKNIRLLILEDNPEDAGFMQTTLKRAGLKFDAKVVSARQDFIDALDSFSPEFILSDHQLPNFISSEALAISRKKFPDIPFILVTGTVSEEFAVEIIKAGADDYILKDRMSRLPSAIEMTLKKRKALKEVTDYKYALDESAIVAITDQKGIIQYANYNFCKISKYTVEELIGQDHRILNSGYHPATYIKDLWIRIANGKIWHGEFCNKAKDGTIYWVNTTIIPFLDEKGKPYQYLSIRIDITERKIIEEELIEREKQLDLFIKHSPAALAMFNNNMQYIAVSQRWITDYKLQHKNLVGESHYAIFPEMPLHWKDTHKRCLAGNIEKSDEDYITNSDGSINWLRWEIHPWRKASGEIGGIIIFSEDITERKKAIATILQSKMRLKQAQEIAQLGNWELNFETNIPILSDEAYNILGLLPTDEFGPDTWRSFIHPYDQEAVNNKIKTSLVEKDDLIMEFKIIRKDEQVRHLYSQTKYEFDKLGNAIGMYGIIHDITKQKEDEEELRKSEMRLNEAQSIAHISNWEIDLIKNTQFWSDEFYNIFRLDKKITKPSTDNFLSYVHIDDLEFAQKTIAAAIQNITDSSFEFRFKRKDGVLRHGYAKWKFDFDKNKKPERLFGIMQDITERKEAEENLRAMEEKMMEQKIQEQKEVGKAMIAGQEKERNYIGKELHDNINQILAGTKIYLGTAAKKNEEVKELVRYPMELIDMSIDEIRLLCHRLVMPLKNIDLEEQIYNLLLKLDLTEKIKTTFAYEIPDGLLNDDLKLNIYRIMQEQVNNIIKYAIPQKVNVEVKTKGKNIDILIADDGIGFDVKAKRDGIGILNMINRAETFNGKLQIKSSPGNGCKIHITIPYK